MRTKNRWAVVVGAIFVQLALGAIYAWSAFTHKLIEPPYSFSKTETQIPFFVELAMFSLVMALFAGRWQQKVGPRRVAMYGGLLLGIGYLIAGISGSHFWGILLGIGFLGGTGIGLGYVCPIAALIQWFPDKKGLITGVAVAGFGFGALIWIKMTSGYIFGSFNLIPGWNGLYGMGWSISQVFLLYGIVFSIIVLLGSFFLSLPPEGWQPPTSNSTLPPSLIGGEINFTEKEMIRTKQFWALLFMFATEALAGLMVIGNIVLFGKETLVFQGYHVHEATLIAGTAMGVFFALMNGIGRIVWGVISEKIGRKYALFSMCLLQGVFLLLFHTLGQTEWGLYLSAAGIGFNFGGNFALFPAAVADFFGNKRVGANYPWVFLGYGLGGILGPLLGGIMGDYQLWVWAFIPAGICSVVASFIALTLSSPKKN